MLYLLVALGFMFFAGIAMTINEGLWSNTILLLCVLISGCASAAAGVPAGMLIFDQIGLDPEQAWYCVFAGMWGVFIVSLLVLRVMVDKASVTRVRFIPILDKIGGILMGLFVALMLTSFASFTLWNAPIKAGEWKVSDASESQANAFRQLVGPFNSVAKQFARADGVDASFFGN